MNFTALYETLYRNKYYIFSVEDLLTFFPNAKRASLKEVLYRWKKKGWMAPLKRGLYELTYPKDLSIPDMVIANALYHPSYVSLETVLSNESIMPEVSMAVTSITTKPTRKFRNKHGLFIYRTVNPAVFVGYYVEQQKDFEIRIAEPEKALVDFLYFKTYRGKILDDDERLDKTALSKLNKRKIARYAKLYRMDLKGFYAYL